MNGDCQDEKVILRLYVRMKMKAVCPVSISEGGFRCMGSVSTLLFLDFHVNQVIAVSLASNN